MMQKTKAFLRMYENQKRLGHDDTLTDDLRQGIEQEIGNEDYRAFYGDPQGEQLKPLIGRMLKDETAKHFESVREGAKGARG